MKELGNQTFEAVESGSLSEPFNAAMLRAPVRVGSIGDYHIVLSEHTTGSGSSNEFFEQVSFGFYRVFRAAEKEELRSCQEDSANNGNEANKSSEAAVG